MEKKPNGLYVLKADGEPTGPFSIRGGQKRVYAFLDGKPAEHQGPVEWAVAEVIDTQHRKGYMYVYLRPK